MAVGNAMPVSEPYLMALAWAITDLVLKGAYQLEEELARFTFRGDSKCIDDTAEAEGLGIAEVGGVFAWVGLCLSIMFLMFWCGERKSLIRQATSMKRNSLTADLDEVSAKRILDILKREFRIRRTQSSTTGEEVELCPNPVCTSPKTVAMDGVCMSCYINREQFKANGNITAEKSANKTQVPNISDIQMSEIETEKPIPTTPMERKKYNSSYN